jgi:hypothetical protein
MVRSHKDTNNTYIKSCFLNKSTYSQFDIFASVSSAKNQEFEFYASKNWWQLGISAHCRCWLEEIPTQLTSAFPIENNDGIDY